MHELSIAQSVVDIVRANVPDHDIRLVTSVKVKVGHLSGVVPDSLDFCFGAIIHGTPLQGARLAIEQVPFTLKCRSCNSSYESEAGIVLCPTCDGSDTEVLSGTELQVVEIELDDELIEKNTG